MPEALAREIARGVKALVVACNTASANAHNDAASRNDPLYQARHAAAPRAQPMA
ncbi:hypothetical protein D3C83_299900 [compost metagenome]